MGNVVSFKKKKVSSLKERQEEQRERVLGNVYDFYSQATKIIERNLRDFENDLREIEKKHGTKVLQETWKTLSFHEKEGVRENFTLMRARLNALEEKITGNAPYKPS